MANEYSVSLFMNSIRKYRFSSENFHILAIFCLFEVENNEPPVNYENLGVSRHL